MCTSSEINLMIIMIHSCPVWWYKWHKDFEEQIVGIAIGFLCEVKKNCAITLEEKIFSQTTAI